MVKRLALLIVIYITIGFSINVRGDNRYKLLRAKNFDYPVVKRIQYDIEVATITDDEEIKNILEQAIKDLAKKREVDALVVRL